MKYLSILLIVFIVTCSSQNALWYVHHYCHEYKVDPRVIFALIKVESSGKYNKVSKAGAWGLGQIMPETARDHYKYMYRKYKTKQYLILSKAPKATLIPYLKNERINIRIMVWHFKKNCLRKSSGNYTMAINLYLNGVNSKKYDWSYVNKVIDEVVKWQ